MSKPKRSRRQAVTLIELLVILAILAFLMALLLPAVQKTRDASTRVQTINNLKHMALSIHSVNDVYRVLPPAYDKHGPMNFPATLHVHVLPYIEQAPLYKNYLNAKGDDPADKAIVPTFISSLDASNPDPPKGIQNFAANLRVFGFTDPKGKFDDAVPLADTMKTTLSLNRIADGTSNTISFATKYGVCGDGGSQYASAVKTKTAAFFGQNPAKVAASPTDANATFQLNPKGKECLNSPLMAQSYSSQLHIALCDGSVRTVSGKLTAQTWNYALYPNDFKQLGQDWNE